MVTKAELQAQLDLVSADEETLAISKVVKAVADIAPKGWLSEQGQEIQRQRVGRVFRHVAERYGIEMEVKS